MLNDEKPTLLVVSRRAPQSAVNALRAKPQVEVIVCGDERVDLIKLMVLLSERGLRTLIAEGGSRLLHSLFEAQLVSTIIIKHIPVISGALEAPNYLRSEGPEPYLNHDRCRIDATRAFDAAGASPGNASPGNASPGAEGQRVKHSTSWLVSDLPPTYRNGDEYFVLMHCDTFYLIKNQNTHRGGPLKFGFINEEAEIVYPMHHTPTPLPFCWRR